MKSDRVRQTAFELHAYLRHGHLEKVYENGLTHRLRKAGMTVEQQCPLQVRDEDGTVLGDYFADLFGFIRRKCAAGLCAEPFRRSCS